MRIGVQAIALSCICSSSVLAQDLVWSDAATTGCLAQAKDDDRQGCVGASATACMADTPGGDTTVGMGGCLDREYRYWDGALNVAYGDLMTLYEAQEAEAKAGGWSGPDQVAALKAMQRAWIAFRDARCDFERAKWGGGTGGGPATLDCLMTATAEQTFLLQDGMDGLQ